MRRAPEWLFFPVEESQICRRIDVKRNTLIEPDGTLRHRYFRNIQAETFAGG